VSRRAGAGTRVVVWSGVVRDPGLAVGATGWRGAVLSGDALMTCVRTVTEVMSTARGRGSPDTGGGMRGKPGMRERTSVGRLARLEGGWARLGGCWCVAAEDAGVAAGVPAMPSLRGLIAWQARRAGVAVWAMRGRLAGVAGRAGSGGGDASSACNAIRACVDCIAGEEWPGGGSTRFLFGWLRTGSASPQGEGKERRILEGTCTADPPPKTVPAAPMGEAGDRPPRVEFLQGSSRRVEKGGGP